MTNPARQSRTTFAYALYQQLPPSWRYRLKEVLGARGHRSSFLDALKSKKDALGKRRLDNVIGNAVDALRNAGIDTLKGKSVLDFGPGYIIADSLCFYLLGAASVTAADLNPIATDRHLALAFAKTDWVAFESRAFAAFPDAAADFSQRRAALENALTHGFEGLAGLGIIYHAPVDYAAKGLGSRFDIIFSTSVLEHLPPEIAGVILTTIYSDLKPGGTMAHVIHLEDHFDMAHHPFAFLAADTDYDPARDFDTRGNRIRVEGWKAICSEIALPAQFVNIVHRSDVLRPERPLPAYVNADPEDVFASWATLVAAKP